MGKKYRFGRHGSSFGKKRRRNPRKKKNPFNLQQEIVSGVDVKDIMVATAAAAALQILESGVSRYVNLDFGGGRLGSAAAKLGIGLGGTVLAEKAGLIERGTEFDRFLKLAAVFSSASDVAQFAIGGLESSVEAFGLGEIIAHPASQGQVVLSELGELSYNPYALGNVRRAPNQSLYTVGEAVAPAAAKGDVVVSNLGYAADAYLGYASDQYGDPRSMGNLGGAFYAGNVGLPQGAAQHPDFMNQVPGRSDLSAVPDFMR